MSRQSKTAKQIFLEAIEAHAPGQWPAFLDKSCGSDAQLRHRVEVLLEAHVEDGGLLDEPATGLAATIDQLPLERPGAQIGPYKLLQEIGQGGFGVVYMAQQKEPVERRVALKIIKPGMDTRQVIARFEAERQALAMMDHQCIARVFDAGATQSGRPYFVMELVKGVPITTYCDQQQLSVKERLELFLPVCHAVQHAHQKGIIHRDLKPSNVLVALHDGVPVPKVIDFGLAKATNQRLTEKTLFTEFGQVVGTLEYMSPEQAELNQLDIDTRTDIYSLGAMLYELLTGSTPLTRARIRNAAFNEILRIIREEEPQKPSTRLSSLQQAALSAVSQQRGIAPRKLPSLFRGELDWVVMKALDKNRTRRYETANGLARDIQHFLSDEAVEARPPSSAYRLRKFASRHRVGMAATAAVTFGLCAAVVGLAVSNRLITHERDQKDSALIERQRALRESKFHEGESRQHAAVADQQRVIAQQNANRAEQQRDEKVRQLYIAHMAIALREWNDRHTARTRELLDAYLPKNNGGVDLRGWEWHYLRRLSNTEARVAVTPSSQLALAFAPDTGLLVTGGEDGVLRFWNKDATQELRSVNAHEGRIHKLAISLDGHVVTAGGDGEVKLWDIATGKVLRSFPGHKENYYGMALSLDGTRLAVALQTIVIFDVATGSEIRRLKGHREGITQLAFSDDGRRLVSSSNDFVQLWETTTGQELGSFDQPDDHFKAVAISRDGRTVVMGHRSGAVESWVVDNGQRIGWGAPSNSGITRALDPQEFGLLEWGGAHKGQITRIVFSPDGRRVATASNDTTIRIWDPATKRVMHTFCGHTDSVTDIAFSTDSDVVTTCGWDSSVRDWDTASRQEQFTPSDPWWVNNVLYSPDGECLAVGDPWMWIMYEASSGRPLWTVKPTGYFKSRRFPPAFDAESRLFAFGDGDLAVQICDVQSGQQKQSWHPHETLVTKIQFLADGRMATGSQQGEIALWSASDAREIARFQGHQDSVKSFALSRDGKLLASGGGDRDRKIHLWNTATGRLVKTLSGHEAAVTALVFSRDASQIFSGGGETICCWNVATGQVVRRQRAWGEGLASTPDGSRLASCGHDATVKIWDTKSGLELFTLNPEKGPVINVAFSPDGLRLAAAGFNGGVTIWDARPLTPEIRVERAAQWLVGSLFKTHWIKEDVIAAIESNTTYPETVRKQATFLAKRYYVSSYRYNRRSWMVVSLNDLSPDRYAQALRAAQAACDLEPGNGVYLNTLGIAQFRLAQYELALQTLDRAGELYNSPANLAFQAMAHYRLGHEDQANLLLAELRETIEQGQWDGDNGTQALYKPPKAFLQEATALISKPGEAPEKTDPPASP